MIWRPHIFALAIAYATTYLMVSSAPDLSTTTVSSSQFGIEDDAKCKLDQTPRIRAFLAAAAGRRALLGPIQVCVTDTLVVDQPSSEIAGIYGKTKLVLNKKSGSTWVPLIDITPKATHVSIHDISLDGQADKKDYVDSQYFGTNAWGGNLLIVEGDDFVGRDIDAANAFINCIGLGAIERSASPPSNIRGAPRRPSLYNIHTTGCGVGLQHFHGAPFGSFREGMTLGRSGAGIDNGSAADLVVDGAIDYQSTIGFIVSDIGAGAGGQWSNVKAFYTKADQNFATDNSGTAMYVGESGSSVVNFVAVRPGYRGVWQDAHANGAGGDDFVNVRVLSPGFECALIQAAGNWVNVTCADPAQSDEARATAGIEVDSSNAPIDSLFITNLTVLGTKEKFVLRTVGRNDVFGRIGLGRIVLKSGGVSISPRQTGLAVDYLGNHGSLVFPHS